MMNHFSMRCDLDCNRQPVGLHETTLTLTPSCEMTMKEHVFPFMEIEIMYGTRRILENGQIEYKFLLDDQKATVLRQALVSAVFPTTDN